LLANPQNIRKVFSVPFRTTAYLIVTQPTKGVYNGALRRANAVRRQAFGGQVPQQLYEATPRTILIVEDNELNMKLFHDLLEAHGYNILQAWNGAEGLTMAHRHRPDLIIMDMHLPEISGLEAMKLIKADDYLMAIPIVAVTAFAMKGDKEKICAGGCDAYIAKPVSIRNFIETVELLIR
jgi:two-component system cell cycle response regulator DivK